jgi:hypothetical protein
MRAPFRLVVSIDALTMYGPSVYAGTLECGHVARVYSSQLRKACKLCAPVSERAEPRPAGAGGFRAPIRYVLAPARRYR